MPGLINQLKHIITYAPYIAAAICIGAALYLIYTIRKKSAADKTARTVSSLADDTAGTAPSVTGETAHAQFLEHAAVFSGLYEAVYRISSGKGRFRQGVAGDFMVRLDGISGIAELKEQLKFLSGYAEWDIDTGAGKMKELMEFFINSGVIRDMAQEVTVNLETYAHYSTADGERLYEGTTAVVITPYWYIDGKVLEKGIIQKKEEANNE